VNEPPAPRTLRLVIEYDGTGLAGWQRQAGQATVQGWLEKAFHAMTGQDILVRGAGRTDAGVHAEGQVASVELASNIPALGFLRGLNTFLPPEIAVLEVSDVPAGFDARHHARGKIYRYQVWNHPVRSPRLARYVWHVYDPLDTHPMREAAAVLLGEHDFRAFRSSDCDRTNTVRILRRLDVRRCGSLISIEVEGTAFLRNMVRILAGTLVAVGRGKMAAPDVAAVLQSGDRTKAGVTAPPSGLALMRVRTKAGVTAPPSGLALMRVIY
jgi:tRNA pseudouridine38-40 synthase